MDKLTAPPDLSPAELERLACLNEELAEAQQVVSKIIRHGYESRDPDKPNSLTNRQLLERELGGVQFEIACMCDRADVSREAVEHHQDCRNDTAFIYRHHDHESDATAWTCHNCKIKTQAVHALFEFSVCSVCKNPFCQKCFSAITGMCSECEGMVNQ